MSLCYVSQKLTNFASLPHAGIDGAMAEQEKAVDGAGRYTTSYNKVRSVLNICVFFSFLFSGGHRWKASSEAGDEVKSQKYSNGKVCTFLYTRQRQMYYGNTHGGQSVLNDNRSLSQFLIDLCETWFSILAIMSWSSLSTSQIATRTSGLGPINFRKLTKSDRLLCKSNNFCCPPPGRSPRRGTLN